MNSANSKLEFGFWKKTLTTTALLHRSSLHHNTSQSSIVELRKDRTDRNRAQYTDLDAIDKGDVENHNENVPANQSSGSRSVQGWCNLRSAVAYYCSLRKIRRDGLIYLTFYIFI